MSNTFKFRRPMASFLRPKLRPIVIDVTTCNEALASSVAALAAVCEDEQKTAIAHSFAEDLGQQTAAGTPEGDAAELAADRADRKWQRDLRRLDKAAKAVLAVPVDNLSDARLKQQVFAAAHRVRSVTDLPFDSDMRDALAALERDTRAIGAATPPPPPITGAAQASAVAALLEESDRAFNEAGDSRDDAPEQIALDARAERLHRQFLRAPITSSADAIAKLRWLSRGIHSGETGHETAVLAQLVTYFGGDPVAVLTVDPGYECATPEDLTFSFDRESQDDAAQARQAWDAAAAAVKAAYEDFDGAHAGLQPAIDHLLTLEPYDVEGLRLLFEVIMTETQALGLRSAEAQEAGDEALTDARLLDACDFPPPGPHPYVAPGNGLSAGLIHIRRALDRLTGQSAAPWQELAEEVDEDVLANARDEERAPEAFQMAGAA